MSVQYIFTKDDPVGGKSTILDNFWRCAEKKPIGWGPDKQIEKSKLFPRGKAYHTLWKLQLHNFILTH